MVELLAPARDKRSVSAAINNNADSVYVGITDYNMRANVANIDIGDIKDIVVQCHDNNKKLYVCTNTIVSDNQLEKYGKQLDKLEQYDVDALIISDMGMINIANKSSIPLHLSVQANITNVEALKLYKELGISRAVLSRELSLKDICTIKRKSPIEIETFVHGAMCVAVSGRCFLSSYFYDRNANCGECLQPCRQEWVLKSTENKELILSNPENNSIENSRILSPRDMCMIEHIPELIEAGIDSFKIEGRMKTALYVATVARTYRLAIDEFLQDPELYKSRIPFYKSEIQKCTYRQYTTGFFFGKPDENTQIYDSNTYVKEYTYLGIVGECNDKGLYHIEQRNKFSVGETIEVMRPDGTNLEVTVKAIYNEDGEAMESAPHPKQQLYIDLGVPLCQYDILRRKED